MLGHILNRYAVEHTRPPERWRRRGLRWYGGGTDRRGCLRPSGGSGLCGLAFGFSLFGMLRLFLDLRDESGALLGGGEVVHDLQTLEGVAGIEDTRVVRLRVAVVLDEKDTPAIGAIDRGAADDDGNIQLAAVELLHTERHLLGGADEQGGEADSIGIDLPRLLQNGIEWHLLTQIVDGVAIVGEDRVDEVFADIVDIAEDGCQHDAALRVAFGPLQIPFQVRDGLLHHLSGLEHEREN